MFNKQNYETWITKDGEAAGEMRQFGQLKFLRVFDAGHMVPMDQPAHALDMLTRHIANDW